MDYSSNWSGPDPTLTVEQFELLLNQGDVLATIVAGNRVYDFLEKNGWGVARQNPTVDSHADLCALAGYGEDCNHLFTGRCLRRSSQTRWLRPLGAWTGSTSMRSPCAPPSVGQMIRFGLSSLIYRTKIIPSVASSPIHSMVTQPACPQHGHPPYSQQSPVEVSIVPSFQPRKSNTHRPRVAPSGYWRWGRNENGPPTKNVFHSVWSQSQSSSCGLVYPTSQQNTCAVFQRRAGPSRTGVLRLGDPDDVEDLVLVRPRM